MTAAGDPQRRFGNRRYFEPNGYLSNEPFPEVSNWGNVTVTALPPAARESWGFQRFG
jgi:hypothetical protein